MCWLSSLFCSTKRRVWKNYSLKLSEILIMKNYGITLIKGNYATSGGQKILLQKQFCKISSSRLMLKCVNSHQSVLSAHFLTLLTSSSKTEVTRQNCPKNLFNLYRQIWHLSMIVTLCSQLLDKPKLV